MIFNRSLDGTFNSLNSESVQNFLQTQFLRAHSIISFILIKRLSKRINN